MENWGIRTWDESGKDNNTGIVRVFVLGMLSVGSGQQSGGASFSVPEGCELDYLFQSSGSFVQKRRRIAISGGDVTISDVSDGDYSPHTQNALAGYYLFYLRGKQ